MIQHASTAPMALILAIYIIFTMFPRTDFLKKNLNCFLSGFNFENLSELKILFTLSHIRQTLVSWFGIFLTWFIHKKK